MNLLFNDEPTTLEQLLRINEDCKTDIFKAEEIEAIRALEVGKSFHMDVQDESGDIFNVEIKKISE